MDLFREKHTPQIDRAWGIAGVNVASKYGGVNFYELSNFLG